MPGVLSELMRDLPEDVASVLADVVGAAREAFADDLVSVVLYGSAADVPDTVFFLLEELAARSTRPLTVVVERDGNYPAFAILLEELDRARGALTRGRARRVAARARVA